MIRSLRDNLDKLMISVSARSLFSKPPIIYFEPSISSCPSCGSVLQVEKTRIKKVVTLDIGAFKAHETILSCKECENNASYSSENLLKLKPFRATFGYDVLVYVGKAAFLRCRSDKEIKLELEQKHIAISAREISYLAKKFVVYLALAHRQSGEKIKSLMKQRGGYILHLDATCEGDSPHLMTGLDGITEIILENVKLASEKAEKIIPFLRRIKQLYGQPLASVHDMGKGILNAVKEVFPNNPDFICHYHFLSAQGKNLFGKENDKIRGRLKKHGIQGKLRKRVQEFKKIIDEAPNIVDSFLNGLKAKSIEDPQRINRIPVVVAYTLALWALEGKKQGKGYGFPFDRPYLTFYQRLETIHSVLRKLIELRWENRRGKRPYVKIFRDLIETMEDPALCKAAEYMQEKGAVFDKLREAMRIAVPDGKHGLNDKGEEADIRIIEKGVKDFCEWVERDAKLSGQDDYKKMIAQIRHYWEKLFSDLLVVDTPKGKMLIQPQRTNNILEQLFRDFKRRYRKKSGMNTLSRNLKAMLSDTPLIKNLENPEYLQIILDGKSNLEERFAEIELQLVLKELSNLQHDSEKVSPKIKKIIKMPELPDDIIALYAG